MKTIYKAIDGTLFEDYNECQKYENKKQSQFLIDSNIRFFDSYMIEITNDYPHFEEVWAVFVPTYEIALSLENIFETFKLDERITKENYEPFLVICDSHSYWCFTTLSLDKEDSYKNQDALAKKCIEDYEKIKEKS